MKAVSTENLGPFSNAKELKPYGLWISNLKQVENNVVFETPSRIFSTECRGSVKIGFMSYLGGGFIKNTTVGRFCCVANAMIGAPAHPTNWLSVHPFQYNGGYFKQHEDAAIFNANFDFAGNKKKTVIGNDVWIGENVVIVQGVTIGDGAIIAANAVVTKDVEPYQIVGGVPAKEIKYRFDKKTIRRLLALKWWLYKIPGSLNIPYNDISTALKQLEALQAAGKLELLAPESYQLKKSSGVYDLTKVAK